MLAEATAACISAPAATFLNRCRMILGMTYRAYRILVAVFAAYLTVANAIRAFSRPWTGSPDQWLAIAMSVAIIGIAAMPWILARYSENYRRRQAALDARNERNFCNTLGQRTAAWLLVGALPILFTANVYFWLR